jgi:IclR family acetate operon transcriptional repressor
MWNRRSTLWNYIAELFRCEWEEKVAKPEITGTQAIDRASALLIHVIEASNPPLLSQLALIHELPKSTTSRLLGALEKQGLIQRDRNGAYLPGSVLTRFARQRNHQLDLSMRMRPVLEKLAEKTGETANLAIAGNGYVELIDQVDGRYLLGATNWVGTKVPYHCSALGKVLLAYGVVKIPSGRLEKRAPRSITTRPALLVELELVRRQGFATIKDELEEGLVAVAAPVRDVDGNVIAAISVSGPAPRITDKQLADFGELIISAISSQQPDGTRKVGAA